YLAVQDANELATADRAIRADARHLSRAGKLEAARLVLGRPQIETQTQQAPKRKAAPNRMTQEITAGLRARAGRAPHRGSLPRERGRPPPRGTAEAQTLSVAAKPPRQVLPDAHLLGRLSTFGQEPCRGGIWSFPGEPA